jgi:GGDEF domain-containing protein
MESVIRILFLVTLITFFSIRVSSAQAIIEFSDRMKNLCQNKSSALSKKMFLIILKSHNNGSNPCRDQYLNLLANSCAKNSCEEIVLAYEDSLKSFEGNVIGQ